MFRLKFAQTGAGMAVKQIMVSDISGKDIPDDQHARIIVEDHPALNGAPVELDVSSDEASKLQGSKIDLVTLVVHEINQAPRRVVLDVTNLNSMFKGVDFEQVLGNARRVEQSQPSVRTRRPRGSGPAAPKGDKVDYTAMDKIGQLHRGRVTETEAALVRDNMDKASANREAQTGKGIDWSDEKERGRYGIEAEVATA